MLHIWKVKLRKLVFFLTFNFSVILFIYLFFKARTTTVLASQQIQKDTFKIKLWRNVETGKMPPRHRRYARDGKNKTEESNCVYSRKGTKVPGHTNTIFNRFFFSSFFFKYIYVYKVVTTQRQLPQKKVRLQKISWKKRWECVRSVIRMINNNNNNLYDRFVWSAAASLFWESSEKLALS